MLLQQEDAWTEKESQIDTLLTSIQELESKVAESRKLGSNIDIETLRLEDRGYTVRPPRR